MNNLSANWNHKCFLGYILILMVWSCQNQPSISEVAIQHQNHKNYLTKKEVILLDTLFNGYPIKIFWRDTSTNWNDTNSYLIVQYTKEQTVYADSFLAPLKCFSPCDNRTFLGKIPGLLIKNDTSYSLTQFYPINSHSFLFNLIDWYWNIQTFLVNFDSQNISIWNKGKDLTHFSIPFDCRGLYMLYDVKKQYICELSYIINKYDTTGLPYYRYITIHKYRNNKFTRLREVKINERKIEQIINQTDDLTFGFYSMYMYALKTQ